MGELSRSNSLIMGKRGSVRRESWVRKWTVWECAKGDSNLCSCLILSTCLSVWLPTKLWIYIFVYIFSYLSIILFSRQALVFKRTLPRMIATKWGIAKLCLCNSYSVEWKWTSLPLILINASCVSNIKWSNTKVGGRPFIYHLCCFGLLKYCMLFNHAHETKTHESIFSLTTNISPVRHASADQYQKIE